MFGHDLQHCSCDQHERWHHHVCIHQHTLQRLPQLLIESSLLANTKLRGLNEAMGQALQCVLASYR
jgi:hypothetical protein